jgi:hypothetical protein
VGTERWADPLHLELTHFYKFEIAEGLVAIGPVLPVMAIRTDHFPPSCARFPTSSTLCTGWCT